MLSEFKKYADIIASYKISKFEEAGSSLRLRARIEFIDGSMLDIRETVIEAQVRKYAYHWQKADESLNVRWDNAPHWKVETFPHHKHIEQEDNVVASFERTLEQVLKFISQQIKSENK